jgi:hypothetical protein
MSGAAYMRGVDLVHQFPLETGKADGRVRLILFLWRQYVITGLNE